VAGRSRAKIALTQLGWRPTIRAQLQLGGFANLKTLNNESTEVLIDGVLLTLE
jgi:hypothetical protein